MSSKKFSNIRALIKTHLGYRFGAFSTIADDAQKGYDLFVSNENPSKDWCECMGFVHEKRCYHLKEARRRVEQKP